MFLDGFINSYKKVKYFSNNKKTIMLTLILVIAGLIGFVLFFKTIDVFDKI